LEACGIVDPDYQQPTQQIFWTLLYFVAVLPLLGNNASGDLSYGQQRECDEDQNDRPEHA
jgi:hypothetical protein